MASISGSQTNAIFAIGSTFGTAVSGGANNKFAGEISPNWNVDELIPRQIGTGNQMITSVERGNFIPTISLNMDAGYYGSMQFMVAQMLGTSSAPAEQTGAQGDYMHRHTFNNTLNAKYGTFAYESSSATVIEYPSCAVRSIDISLEDAPGIMQFSAELLANNAVITGTTNSNASLAAATLTDTSLVAFDFADTFQMNANSGGSLSSGDQFNIKSYNLSLSRPQDVMGEIKGAAGNSAPISQGLFEGTLTVTLKELADHTLTFTEWAAQTYKKCKLNVQGTQIASGVNRAVTIYIPKMVQVGEPNYAITSEGVNEVTVTYRIVDAGSNPTGMNSTKPYFEFINTRSTSFLA